MAGGGVRDILLEGGVSDAFFLRGADSGDNDAIDSDKTDVPQPQPGLAMLTGQRMSTGTLAEWLTRCPAKAFPSGACVRITQVSFFFFGVFNNYSL